MPPARRGRPLKFGRPGQTITLTLPDDVIAWLRRLNDDPAWAIVELFDRGRQPTRGKQMDGVAELVQMPGGRGLILVRPEVLRNVRGVAVVPLSDGRAFIALEAGGGVADLEVAILDRLDSPGVSAAERAQLLQFRQVLREWRRQGLKFEPRTILVVERQGSVQPARALAPRLATTG